VNDIAPNLHLPGHESKGTLFSRLRRWWDDFRDRLAEPRNTHGTFRLSHLLENSQARGLEFRDRHFFHGPDANMVNSATHVRDATARV
jgi:hypothetical protein